jgi:hypothetical protein
LEKGLLGDSDFYPSTGNTYLFFASYVFTTMLVAGLPGLLIAY